MFCRSCGKKIDADALFCPHCKRSTYYAPSEPTPAEKQSGTKAPPSKAAKPAVSKNKAVPRKWIGSVLCLLLILGGTVAYMSFGTIVSVPDPGQFIGLSPSISGRSGQGTHKHTATIQSAQAFSSGVQEYVDYLESQYNLDITWESQKPFDMLGIQYLNRYVLEYDGFWIPLAKRPRLSVYYYTNDSGNYYCTVHYDKTVGLKDYTGTRSAVSQAAQPEDEPAEEPLKSLLGAPPSPDSTLLPDIGTYLGVSAGQVTTNGINWDIRFTDSDDAVEEELLSLLKDPRYQLKLEDSLYEDYRNTVYELDETIYLFRYTGTSGRISSGSYNVTISADFAVALSIERYYADDKICISLDFDKDFELEDPGVRTSQKVEDYHFGSRPSESSGHSGGSNATVSTLPKLSINCTKCHGNKKIDCSNCNGLGYKIKWESAPNFSGSSSGSRWAETKEDCSECPDGKVECDRCKGTGKE